VPRALNLTMRRRIVLALADTHAGHRLALLNPETILIGADDDGEAYEWTPEPTETQRLLWTVYQEHIALAQELAGDDEIVVLHDGDLTNGDKYNATGKGNIADTTREDQRQIAAMNLTPLLALPNVRRARIITGTASHVPDAAEARIAHALAGTTGKDVRSSHHSRFGISGVPFDVAHHGPGPGLRDWLRGNVARYYLRDLILRDRRLGKEPARVYIRAHFHIWVPETLHDRWRGRQQRFDLTVLPSYTGLTGYARQVTGSEPVVINGLCCYEVVDGKLVDVHPFVDEFDTRQEETL